MFMFKVVLIPQSKKKKSMTFCSVLSEVWQTGFIPNNSCVEEVTLLEKQIIGKTQGRGRYEDGADSWKQIINRKFKDVTHQPAQCYR